MLNSSWSALLGQGQTYEKRKDAEKAKTQRLPCPKCTRTFLNEGNRTNHIQIRHPEILNPLEPHQEIQLRPKMKSAEKAHPPNVASNKKPNKKPNEPKSAEKGQPPNVASNKKLNEPNPAEKRISLKESGFEKISPKLPSHLRHRYSNSVKQKIIARYDELVKTDTLGATQKLMEEYPNLPINTFRHWIRPEQRQKLHQSLTQREFRAAGQCKETIQKRRHGKFAVQEQKLWELMAEERAEGFGCDGDWFAAKMLKLLEEDKPAGWQSFKASPGWIHDGFLKRYLIHSPGET